MPPSSSFPSTMPPPTPLSRSDDLDFFQEHYEPGLKARLHNVVSEPFQVLTYTDAIELLLRPEHAAAGKFEKTPYWGIDLGSEHERYITEKVRLASAWPYPPRAPYAFPSSPLRRSSRSPSSSSTSPRRSSPST